MGRYGGAFAGRVDDAADTSAEAKAQRVQALFPAGALPATTLIVPETQTRDRCRFSFSRTSWRHRALAPSESCSNSAGSAA